jgi:hypothetical protein
MSGLRKTHRRFDRAAEAYGTKLVQHTGSTLFAGVAIHSKQSVYLVARTNEIPLINTQNIFKTA